MTLAVSVDLGECVSVVNPDPQSVSKLKSQVHLDACKKPSEEGIFPCGVSALLLCWPRAGRNLVASSMWWLET